MSSIREALEAAETSATAGESTPTPAPETAGEASPTPVPETSATSEASGPARGPDGKFTKAEASSSAPPKPKNGATGPEKPSTGPTSTPAPAAATAIATPPPAAPKYKAPASWKLQLRDKFGSIPEDVQAEIDRVHRANEEGVRALKAQADAAAKWQKTYEPYAPVLGAEGHASVAPWLSLAQTMRTGSAQQKAAEIARLVREHNVDLEPLARAIDGGPQQGQQYMSPEAIRQQIQQEAQQMFQRQAQEEARNRAMAEIESFGATKEFFEDVKGEMGVVLGAAHRRGEAMTLEQAYEKACRLHPEVSEYMNQRKAKADADAAAAKAAAAKASAVSVRTDPAGGTHAEKPKSIRALLESHAESA